MPLHDGTGPRGRGPGTGRAKGVWCRSAGYRAIPLGPVLRRKLGGMSGVAVTLAGVILRDLINPSGVIRKIAGLIGVKTSRSKSILLPTPQNSLPDASAVPALFRKKIS